MKNLGLRDQMPEDVGMDPVRSRRLRDLAAEGRIRSRWLVEEMKSRTLLALNRFVESCSTASALTGKGDR